jgi:hypothetical protein
MGAVRRFGRAGVRGIDFSYDIFFGYISIAAVTAAQGSALTAGHFFQTPKK